MPKDTWINASETLPSEDQVVLTYGQCGYVVASYEPEWGWQARHADYDTGEPWLRDGDGMPVFWMPIPSLPN